MYTVYTILWVVLLAAAFWFAIKRGLVARLRQALRARLASWSAGRCDALLWVALMLLVGGLDLLGVALWPQPLNLADAAQPYYAGPYGPKPPGTIFFLAYMGFWGSVWALLTGRSMGQMPYGNSATRVVVLLLLALAALALIPVTFRLTLEVQACFQ